MPEDIFSTEHLILSLRFRFQQNRSSSQLKLQYPQLFNTANSQAKTHLRKPFLQTFFWLLLIIGVLKTFAKFHRKIPVLETLCRPSRLQRRYFPMKFENFQVYRFLQNTSGGCFCTLNFMCKSSLCRVKIFYQRYEIIDLYEKKDCTRLPEITYTCLSLFHKKRFSKQYIQQTWVKSINLFRHSS